MTIDGNYAADLLDLGKHPSFARVLEETKERIIEEWQAAKDPLKREACWAELQGLERLITRMRVVIDEAFVAKRQAEKQNRS